MAGRYDVIVVGAGAMGSAATYHLASRGMSVLALDQFHVPHDRGSSHGITRIIRMAYFEHPSYVPLLRRAYELWRELERETGEQLLHITGSIDAGAIFENSLKSCQLHSLPHTVLTSAELSARFPAYRLPADTMALFQPDGGFLTPESCISAHLNLATSKGAEVRGQEMVLGWEETQNGAVVRTDTGIYHADYLVITAGAWISKLVPELADLAVPERQVVAWLQPRSPELFDPARFPVFNLRLDDGHFYGFPEYGVPGFKFGRYHHRHEIVDPDTMNREADAEDERLLRTFAAKYFPEGAGPTLALQTCLFTNTPDEHFILDFAAGFSRVIVGSPCSGHGFKFSSVIGEILADLVERGETGHDISMHRLARLTTNRSPRSLDPLPAVPR
jgi:sarcosine oxidase